MNMVDLVYTGSYAEAQSMEILGRSSILAYGVGHMLNDITSACWFTYLLLFLTDIGLTPRDAATVMLSGQVADAFSTIFAGELIDSFGHFKAWHAGGSILVALSFSSVFGGCLICNIIGKNSSNLQKIWYSVSAAIFNIGWAATQVSHMSMLNCITLNPTSRVALASCRNAFTMVANLSLYAVAFVTFAVCKWNGYADIKIQYHWIAYLSIFIGCCFVGIFLIGTKEPELKRQNKCRSFMMISWTHWFRKIMYYQVALVYMLTRLITNISQALIAFYIINDLHMVQSSKALVPATTYVCSFLVSIILQEVRWSSWRLKAFFITGALMWIFSGAGVFFLPCNKHNGIYILSISIGVANALMTVTSISMQSILVGEDLNGCAFVYGSLSFFDKTSCGLALYVLESYQASPVAKNINDNQGMYSATRFGVGIVPACCALLAALVASTMKLHNASPRSLADPLLV